MKARSYLFVLMMIISAGALLRLLAITTHSLWWDELLRMKIADPSRSFSDISNLCKTIHDPAPVGIYWTLNAWMSVFGYTDLSARLLMALMGILSLPVIFMLTELLSNKKAALIATAIVAVNYYHIYYSVDVGYYPALFLLSCCSYLFFIRSVQQGSGLSLVFYILSTLALVYLHHFAVLIFAAQVLSWLAIFRMELLKKYRAHIKVFIAFCIIGVAYLPSFYALRETTSLNLNLEHPGNYFFVNYFSAYFGSSGITVIPALALFILFLSGILLFPIAAGSDPVKNNAYMILLIWILFPLTAAYATTAMGTISLVDRYTIVILPGLLMTLAMGLEFVQNKTLKIGFLLFFLCCSCIEIILGKGFYQSSKKDDFKGVVHYIGERQKAKDYFVLSDKNWFFQYYFNLENLTPQYLDHETYSDNRFFITDRIYRNEWLVIDTTIKDIWIISAHFKNLDNMKHISDTMQQSQRFTLIDSFEGYDAFAHHLVRKY